MRKCIIFVVILTMLFCLCSCTKSKTDDTDDSSVVSDYTNIECEEYDKFEDAYFSDKKGSTILKIFVPKKWGYDKTEQGYNIVELSEVIGNITFSDKFNPEDYAESVHSDEVEAVGVFVTHIINKQQAGENVSYSHTFIYKYDDKNSSKYVIINMPYEKVSAQTASSMMRYASTEEAVSDKYLGALRINDNRKRILIMGNSFINSSKVGDTLQKMCGSSLTVEAHSRGYAQVKLYAEDTFMMNEIAGGKYSAVFICGFYSSESVTALKTIVDVCRNSNTKLAIFPAHNENRSAIDSAAASYKYPMLIDWKAEIDEFINNGIEKEFFCINDAHFHSTAIVGYIGAHMIYRALFGKIPTETYAYDNVSQIEIDRLGEYKKTGFVAPKYSNSICYFN